jgi:hypothetical protein
LRATFGVFQRASARSAAVPRSDPLGSNPKGTPFNPNIFNLYKSPISGFKDDGTLQRASIARGEVVFNTTQINITGVTGLNDVLHMQTVQGFCGTCHDTPNVGNHSVKAPLNIGIANAGTNVPPALDISGLPVFTLNCTAGPFSGQTFVVTDPGRARQPHGPFHIGWHPHIARCVASGAGARSCGLRS